MRAIRVLGYVGTLIAGTAAIVGADDQQLIKYFRKKSNVPPAQEVKVTGVKDSVVKGLKEGTLDVGGRKVPFVMSADGRYAIFAAVEDVTSDPSKAVMEKISLKGEPFKGGANAKVIIIEYSDFQCPFCTRGYATIENEVLKTYGDKVKFYYKNFPLAFHKWAEPGAVAGSICRIATGSASVPGKNARNPTPNTSVQNTMPQAMASVFISTLPSPLADPVLGEASSPGRCPGQ